MTRRSTLSELIEGRASRTPGADALWLAVRLVVGTFLVWGVWDNIVSAQRMAEFAGFLKAHGFVTPSLMAPLSVYAQAACGLAFILGLLTRPAGVVCAINFVVALVMVDWGLGPRAAFPTGLLILIGLMLAEGGAGRFSLDAVLRGRLRPR